MKFSNQIVKIINTREECNDDYFRNAEYQLPTTELVPGDVICINPSEIQEIQCDAVLIEGSCSIDESMLTGESYPITKVSAISLN